VSLVLKKYESAIEATSTCRSEANECPAMPARFGLMTSR